MKNVATEQLGPMAREATRLLKAMAHPSRLLICCQLREGEMSVGHMESTLGIRQPNLSRELARLRDDGIVATRRESRVVFYRLHHERAESLIDAICGVILGDDAVDAEYQLEGSEAIVALRRQGEGSSAQTVSAAPDAGVAAAVAEGVATESTGAHSARTDGVFDHPGGYGVFARTGAGGRGENT